MYIIHWRLYVGNDEHAIGESSLSPYLGSAKILACRNDSREGDGRATINKLIVAQIGSFRMPGFSI